MSSRVKKIEPKNFVSMKFTITFHKNFITFSLIMKILNLEDTIRKIHFMKTKKTLQLS